MTFRRLYVPKRAALFSLFFCCSVLVSTISNGQQLLTLPDAINIALKKSYDIQIAKSNIDIDRINNNIGVAGGLPTVTGSLNENESLNSLNQQLSNGNNTKRSNTGSNAASAGVTGSILLF